MTGFGQFFSRNCKRHLITEHGFIRYAAGVAEWVDAPDLGSGADKAWGFESLRPHQIGLSRHNEI